jgi:antitoxin (DNA-binding transcriptional repressor) of toxin-antitoxin stability system
VKASATECARESAHHVNVDNNDDGIDTTACDRSGATTAELCAVKDGETILVTNYGEVVAVLSPPPLRPLGGIRHRPPLIRGGFADVPLVTIAGNTESALDALRGER